jgi:UDP-sugar pyrophosphorylase
MASGADAAAALGISGDGEWAAACPPLRRNLQLLAPDEVSAACY